MRFASDFIPCRHESTVTELFTDGEFVAAVLDERTVVVHTLNSFATAVWLLCAEPVTVDSMCRELVSILGSNPAQTRIDVDEALAGLWGSGLLNGSPPNPVLDPAAS